MLVGKKRPRTILMPSDYLSKEDRRLYQRSGPVLVYFKGGIEKKMNENLRKLLAMSPKEAQEALKFKVHDQSDQVVAAEYGVDLNVIRKFRQDLQLQKDRMGKVVKVGDNPKWPPNIRIDLDRPPKTAVVKQQTQEPVIVAQPAAQQLVPRGLFIRVNGKYPVKDLSFYFDSVRALLVNNPENESREFNIVLELSEVQA